MTSVFSWQNSISLCPASFRTPRQKFSCYSRCFLISYFLHSSPIKGHLFWLLVLKGLVGLHRTIQLQLLLHYLLGQRLGLLVILNGLTWKVTIILSFLRLHTSTEFWTLLLTIMATLFLPRDSCPH